MRGAARFRLARVQQFWRHGKIAKGIREMMNVSLGSTKTNTVIAWTTLALLVTTIITTRNLERSVG
jgi:hypothetical protein